MKYDIVERIKELLRFKGMEELSEAEIEILKDINDSGLYGLDGLRASEVCDSYDCDMKCREFRFNNKVYHDVFTLIVFDDHAIFQSEMSGLLLKINYSISRLNEVAIIGLESMEMNRESDILKYKKLPCEGHKRRCQVEIYTNVFGCLKEKDPEKPIPDFEGILEEEGSYRLKQPTKYLLKNDVDYFYNQTSRSKANNAGCMLYEMDDIYRSTCKLNGQQKVLK